MAALWRFFIVMAALSALGSGSFVQLIHVLGSDRAGQVGSLEPELLALCEGKSQSPIDVVTDKAVLNKKLDPLVRDYHSGNVTLINYKFTVGIVYPDHTGEITVDGKKYSLKQMHWHSPSEHRINGRRFAAELHIVHVSDDGKVLVVGTLFKYGHPDPVLRKIQEKLDKLASNFRHNEATNPITLGPFHPAILRTSPSKYYRYMGSFSIPPCTENTIYLILAKARTISREQVEALKAPLDTRCKYNARPCQPINGRQVEVYEDLATSA